MKRIQKLDALKNHGLTIIEVMVVLAVVCLLAGLAFSLKKQPQKPKSIVCVNNLRQMGSALIQYAAENNETFPFQITNTNGPNNASHVVGLSQYFQKTSRSIASPQILICPFDTRIAAADFEKMTDSNISYFLNLDASRNSAAISILSGDRFLQVDGRPVSSGVFQVTTNSKITWTPSQHQGGGNVLWSDGSVQQTKSQGLPVLMQNQSMATTRFLIP
jgi:prepilin-type N-terminal cleavage/methylation domain-containing protein/prepilin-type processing-associated H-X9-DG protein